MKHIRYIANDRTVCDIPEQLDTFNSAVAVDFIPADDVSCKECLALVMAHNQKSFEHETAYGYNRIVQTRKSDDIYGLAIWLLVATWVCIIIGAVVWAILSR